MIHAVILTIYYLVIQTHAATESADPEKIECRKFYEKQKAYYESKRIKSRIAINARWGTECKLWCCMDSTEHGLPRDEKMKIIGKLHGFHDRDINYFLEFEKGSDNYAKWYTFDKDNEYNENKYTETEVNYFRSTFIHWAYPTRKRYTGRVPSLSQKKTRKPGTKPISYGDWIPRLSDESCFLLMNYISRKQPDRSDDHTTIWFRDVIYMLENIETLKGHLYDAMIECGILRFPSWQNTELMKIPYSSIYDERAEVVLSQAEKRKLYLAHKAWRGAPDSASEHSRDDQYPSEDDKQ